MAEPVVAIGPRGEERGTKCHGFDPERMFVLESLARRSIARVVEDVMAAREGAP